MKKSPVINTPLTKDRSVNMMRRIFTLTELIVVTIIILLITGLAIGRVGKMPAFASLDKEGAEVCSFLRSCALYSTGSGREIRIGCDTENRKLFVIQYVNMNNDGELVYSDKEKAFAHIVDLGDDNSDRTIKTEKGEISLPPVAELKKTEIVLPETIQIIIPEAFGDKETEKKDDDIDIDAETVKKADSATSSVTVESTSGPNIIFRFSPDGSASGGPILLKLDAHAVEILASPLTGAVTMREVDLKEYSQKYRIDYVQ